MENPLEAASKTSSTTKEPNINEWLREARASEQARECGMFLLHTGVVRSTSKQYAREGIPDSTPLSGLDLSYDEKMLKEALAAASTYEGVHYVRVWINQGNLNVGDTMMYVLVGADIRPRCISALEKLVETIKTRVVIEKEVFA